MEPNFRLHVTADRVYRCLAITGPRTAEDDDRHADYGRNCLTWGSVAHYFFPAYEVVLP